MEESCVTERLAVFMPNWVGDAVMATPALRALSQWMAGRGHMLGVMQPVVSEVLRGSPWFADEILFSKRSWRSRLELAVRLRAERIDTIVLLTNSLWTAAVAKLAGAGRRIGYARDGRGWMLSQSLPVLKRSGQNVAVPAVDYYLQLAEKLIGCSTSDRRMQLTVDRDDLSLADRLWKQIGFSDQRPTVVINSSGAWGAAKLWPVDHVEQLARRIAENHQWQVLLHCGPAERAAADAVAARVDHRQVRSMGQSPELPIGLTKAVLARASAVVSTDSGPRHIAVALNRPVVSLFGPTDPAWTTTYNAGEIELGVHNLPCRGCWEKVCPLKHHRCMRDLGVETVYGSVVQAVHRSASHNASQNSRAA